MRVIRRGDREQEAWHYEATCECCKSLLEVEPRDLTYVPDSRDGYAVTFACEICGRITWISASLIPSEVLAKIHRLGPRQ